VAVTGLEARLAPAEDACAGAHHRDGIEIVPVVPDSQVLDEADRTLNLDSALIASLGGPTD